MKTSLKIKISALIASAAFFVSCASVRNGYASASGYSDLSGTHALIDKVPEIGFVAPGIRYEVEDMYLKNMMVVQEAGASRGLAVQLLDETSSAKMVLTVPAGTYECLVNVNASDFAHSAFYVYIDGNPHRVYTNNPPLRDFELTSRAPVYFTIMEERNVTVEIRANSEERNGSCGMLLDCIQFVRRY